MLPHVLEFAAEPHRILREVERVLVPEGQVVIAGFNPLSLWGASAPCPAAAPTIPGAATSSVCCG